MKNLFFNRTRLAFRFGSLILVIASLLASSAQAFAAPQAMLNLSSIGCVGKYVEVHFVVVNLPDGITPGALTFYGVWPNGTGSETMSGPTQISGGVYHYSWYGHSGHYEITGAVVELSDGTTLNLHNPGEYTGDYMCDCSGLASCTGWSFYFMHPLVTDATITVYAKISDQWEQVGYGTAVKNQNPMTTVTGTWTAPVPPHETQIKFVIEYAGRTLYERATKPDCTSGAGHRDHNLRSNRPARRHSPRSNRNAR